MTSIGIDLEMKVDGLNIQMYRNGEYDEEYNEFNDGAQVEEYQINNDVDDTGEDLPEGNRSSGFRNLDLDGTHPVTSEFIKDILRRKRNIKFAPGQESYIPEDTRSLYCYGGDSLENVMKEHMEKPFMNWLNSPVIEFRDLMKMLFETNTVIKCDGRSYPINKINPCADFGGLTYLNDLYHIMAIINNQWYLKKYLEENVAVRVYGYRLRRPAEEPRSLFPDERPYSYFTLESSAHTNDRPMMMPPRLEEPEMLLDKRYLARTCGVAGEDDFDYRKYNQQLNNTLSENNLDYSMYLYDTPFITEF
jgi:hypothetical protein